MHEAAYNTGSRADGTANSAIPPLTAIALGGEESDHQELMTAHARKRKILVTGAAGQFGAHLVSALRDRYGRDLVVPSDIRMSGRVDSLFLDCTSPSERIEDLIIRNDIGTIYHLAGILPIEAEAQPQVTWKVNVGGLYEMLEAARRTGCALFFPSSIAAFGPSTPQQDTPQDTIQHPTTIYGISKVTGELLCDYYFTRFGVDTRGIRFPALISLDHPKGYGSSDFATDLLMSAIHSDSYTCFIGPDTYCAMMYLPDAARAAIELMEAAPERLRHRNAFNVNAMCFTPELLAKEVRRRIPDFKIKYSVSPIRQAIADSWPKLVDDSAARNEWDWQPSFDLQAMTAHALKSLTSGRPRIFLCHAKEDGKRVAELHVRLRDSGFDSWYDKEMLNVGDRWDKEILEAIRNTDFFALCLSRSAVSKRGFVQREIRAAVREFQLREFDLAFLIPIRLEDCTIPDIKFDESTTLRSIQWEDLFSNDDVAAFDRLVKGIWLQWNRKRARSE